MLFPYFYSYNMISSLRVYPKVGNSWFLTSVLGKIYCTFKTVADIQRVSITVLSAPTYGQCPKCSKSTLSYVNVKYPKYPKYNKSIQTMYPVHSSKSSQQHKQYYIPRHNSPPYSQRIQSSLVVRCTFLIYVQRRI